MGRIPYPPGDLVFRQLIVVFLIAHAEKYSTLVTQPSDLGSADPFAPETFGLDRQQLGINEESLAIAAEIRTQTDRAAALIATAYLDTRLADTIKSRLSLNPALEARLFSGYGALADFSGRIDMALALKIITPRGGRDLHRVRKIRNDFAHDATPMNFESQRIRAICKNLEWPEVHKERYDPRNILDLKPARRRFLMTTSAAMYSLYQISRTSVPIVVYFKEQF